MDLKLSWISAVIYIQLSWIPCCHGSKAVMDPLLSWIYSCYGSLAVMDLLLLWIYSCHGSLAVKDLQLSWIYSCHGSTAVMIQNIYRYLSIYQHTMTSQKRGYDIKLPGQFSPFLGCALSRCFKHASLREEQNFLFTGEQLLIGCSCFLVAAVGAAVAVGQLQRVYSTQFSVPDTGKGVIKTWRGVCSF